MRTSTNGSKPFVERYLRHFAAFFANVSDDKEQDAQLEILNMRGVDREAEAALEPPQFDHYRRRRVELSTLFKNRLRDEIRNQVEDATIERAEALILSMQEGGRVSRYTGEDE